MTTIIRYTNRKLYNKDTSKYLTVGELARLPLGTFKVERHGTGEDITTDILLSSLTTEKVERKTKIQVMKHCIKEMGA